MVLGDSCGRSCALEKICDRIEMLKTDSLTHSIEAIAGKCGNKIQPKYVLDRTFGV
ncbi:hypothetical protein [Argonema galeatum]|uniref:hypothetical protein n=1 Tax=Argonema galeatum TaxID=2942762 RepID=UPI0020112BA4|nr:hypothetical protein [Argonema galeatum]MCL1468315.1 hypothetical protein [Argonema galeatum A003/A1]